MRTSITERGRKQWNASTDPARADTLNAYLGGRNNNLNLIRIVAASAVLVSHSYVLTTGDPGQKPLVAQTGLSLGTFSVIVFFAISGLVIARSFDRRSSLAHFIAARVLRLWPGLLVVLALSAFVIGPAVTTLPWRAYWYHHALWTYVPVNFTLVFRQDALPGVFDASPFGNSVNGSLWSLFYVVSCYGVVVLLGLLGLLRRGWAFTLFMAIVVAAHLWALTHRPPNGLMFRLQVFAFYGFPFALGIAAYVWRDHLPIKGWLALAVWLLPLAFHATIYEPTGLMIALTYTSYYLAFVPQGVVLLYNRLGDYSYGIYIYAFPAQQILVNYFPHMSPVQHMACAAPIVLLFAIASWHGFESHALVLARPWGSKGAKPAAIDQCQRRGHASQPQINHIVEVEWPDCTIEHFINGMERNDAQGSKQDHHHGNA